MPSDLPPSLPPKVETYIRKKIAQGEFPSDQELKKYASAHGELLTANQARHYKRYFTHLAQLSSKNPKPKKYAGMPYPVYGVLFADLAFLYQEWSAHNDGNIGFLCAVEASTQQLFAKPFKKKDAKSWDVLIQSIIDESTFGSIRTICIDREPAVASQKFRDKIKKVHGISLVFLAHRNKAFLAEVFIYHLKRSIAQTTAQRKENGDPNWKNWISRLTQIVKWYNGKKAMGTEYRRKDIKLSNFPDYLNSLFKTRDATLLFNTRGALNADRMGSTTWVNRFFTLEKDARVLVHKRALANVSKEKFLKASSTGAFSRDPKIVTNRLLKKSSDNTVMIPG